jgi:dTDP-4-dehydrorhamnose reductase
MKFLVVGASGMIGNAFMSELSQLMIPTCGTYHTRQKSGLEYLDMTNLDATFDLLARIKPDIVVQTAAQPNVDYCEQYREEAWRTNVLGTGNLVRSSERIGAKHVFMSTDYVFDGTAGPYSEEDPVNPINYYAMTKVEGENRVRSLDNHLVIRTGVVFDAYPNSKNFALRVVKELSAGHSIRVPIDQIGNPTLASNLAACVVELALKDKLGVYNVAGRSIMPRFDFARKICETFNLDVKLIHAVTSEELQQKARRPKKLGLKTDKAARELATELLEVDAALGKFKDKLRDKLSNS